MGSSKSSFERWSGNYRGVIMEILVCIIAILIPYLTLTIPADDLDIEIDSADTTIFKEL